jgi:putative membrane protein
VNARAAWILIIAAGALLIVLLIAPLFVMPVMMERPSPLSPAMPIGPVERAWISPMAGIALLWMLLPVGLMALVAGLIVVLLRSQPAERHPGPETPLAIAQRRYASGEIGRDEYERIREDLSR